nr:phosphonate ABC transporter, permease protein PhnE [Truepera radiovictrix]
MTPEGPRRVWHRHTPQERLRYALGWALGVLVLALCWRLIAAQTTWLFVQDAPRQAGDLFSRMLPPRWSYAPTLLRPLWDTLNIATLGTLLALLVATPVAFMAARNTTPHPLLRAAALLIIVVSRSVHSLIWAVFLVYLVGPGVFAGVIAIALRSVGFIAKLLFEAIEEINPKPVEAVRATGGSGLQVLTYGVVPQVLPAWTGISVFRWDINIRESTFLGLVGAGGIGLQLNASVNALAWAQASVIFIAIFGLVLFSEWVSARVRGAIT